MTVIETGISDLIVLAPQVHTDDRGYFFEAYNINKVPQVIADRTWVQDNESKSERGVLRGMHYQCGDHAQGKLVRVTVGEVYDVAIDMRPESATYGQHYGVILNDQNKKQMYIPRGFAHGFLVLSDTAIFTYKCDNFYHKESEGGVVYNDPKLAINWPIEQQEIIISDRDNSFPRFGHHKPAI